MDYRFEFYEKESGKPIKSPRMFHFNEDFNYTKLVAFTAGQAAALQMIYNKQVKISVYEIEGDEVPIDIESLSI
jgi:hypothetical protein